jgi:hypothetical protein
MYIDIIPKDKKIDNLLSRLMQHPYQRTDPKVTQALSRYKKIRYLNEIGGRNNPYIDIRNGGVGLRDNVTIIKTNCGFRFKIIP